MNLLRDRLFPVKRASSSEIHWIAPWEITSRFDEDPVVSLCYTRPDIAGSMAQFFIGLLQTIVHDNDDEDQWLAHYDTPPDPDQLRQWCEPWEAAFNVDGEGPRFMQDLNIALDQNKPVAISGLLMDAPGGNALKFNRDHFTKRDVVQTMSLELAVAALFQLQLSAPSGGQGHRTSMRGGGPLTTLLVTDSRSEGKSLWRSLWLNVLDWGNFEESYSCIRPDEPSADIFPWMAPTRESNTKELGTVTTIDDVHPLQMYWSMPRRIRLDFAGMVDGNCDLGGPAASKVLTSYFTKNYGANYEGAWDHPLSPYYQDKEGHWLPLHANTGGLTYRDWQGLVATNSGKRRAARVVRLANQDYRYEDIQLRVWAFGYHMDNANALAWYEALLPLYPVQEENSRIAFTNTVDAMVEAAQLARGYLQTAVKAAWFRRPGDKKGDTSAIDLSFWRRTEPDFYSCVDSLHSVHKGSGDDSSAERESIRSRWFQILKSAVNREFDTRVNLGDSRMDDHQRIVRARKELQRSLNGPKLKHVTLDLPKATTKRRSA